MPDTHLTDRELATIWDHLITNALATSPLPILLDRTIQCSVVVGPNGVSTSWIGPHPA